MKNALSVSVVRILALSLPLAALAKIRDKWVSMNHSVQYFLYPSSYQSLVSMYLYLSLLSSSTFTVSNMFLAKQLFLLIIIIIVPASIQNIIISTSAIFAPSNVSDYNSSDWKYISSKILAGPLPPYKDVTHSLPEVISESTMPDYTSIV